MQEVVWSGEAEFRGEEVRVLLRTEFPFGKFRLTQPRVSVVLSVENRIRLEVEPALRRKRGGAGFGVCSFCPWCARPGGGMRFPGT